MATLKLWAALSFLFATFYGVTGSGGDGFSFWLQACWTALVGIAIVSEIRKLKP